MSTKNRIGVYFWCSTIFWIYHYIQSTPKQIYESTVFNKLMLNNSTWGFQPLQPRTYLIIRMMFHQYPGGIELQTGNHPLRSGKWILVVIQGILLLSPFSLGFDSRMLSTYWQRNLFEVKTICISNFIQNVMGARLYVLLKGTVRHGTSIKRWTSQETQVLESSYVWKC